MKRELVYPELSYKINGLLFKVHNNLGKYCNEKQHGDLFERKLKENNIKYEREKILPEFFMGEKNGRNRIDFLIKNKIILELKCKRIIDRSDFYQTKRYLVALNKRLSLLVNFNVKYLSPKRVLNPNCKD
ncbi:MAG: GxxExxY protein [Candidatus Moranbacteria bacterium]|nr:GxxExxY protein [Candidatus Moranbacteria bacterium]